VVSVHSSKGLEFQAVVVVGLGEIQQANAPETDNTRLLYVAMTRARRQLVLTASRSNGYVEQLAKLGPMRQAA
jgi:superfamily I DNA/RNA helicase